MACCGVRGTEYHSPGKSPFEGGLHCRHHPYHSSTSGQTTGREHSPTHQQKTGFTEHGPFHTVHGVLKAGILKRFVISFSGFRKGRGARDQIANICWIIEKAKEFQKNIYFCFIDYAKAFDCVDHNKLWKLLKEMGIPDHLICLLKNLYAGQEAIVRTEHETKDWFQIGKGERQGYILSSYIFNYYAEYIMQNAGWDEPQVGIKISGRNINNLRYADDTTLMAESKDEVKSLLMKVKEESEKAALKLNIQKTTIMASGPITSRQIDG